MGIMIPSPRLTGLNYNEILMYLGYRGQEISSELDSQIYNCMDQITRVAEPKAVFREVPVQDGMPVGFLLQGKDIAELLGSCHTAIFMAATLGPAVDRYLLRAEVKNMTEALILDACASAAIENVCGNLEADIRQEVEADGDYLTDRFSPGYGDLPLDTQKALGEFLNTGRRIGLSITENSLMIPRKSVSAIMGVSHSKPKMRARGCEVCSMFKTCTLRKDGKNCGM